MHLKCDATPHHGHAYTVPKSSELKFNKEVNSLFQIGVLKNANHSQWAAPTFILPRINKTTRFISDNCKGNNKIKSYSFLISSIKKLTLKLEGSQWTTVLDLNMASYCIGLYSNNMQICTIVLP